MTRPVPPAPVPPMHQTPMHQMPIDQTPMRILLVNEASGVHAYLGAGLRQLGHHVHHVLTGGQPFQRRSATSIIGPPWTGLAGTLSRHLVNPFRVRRYHGYDIANFVLGMSLLSGRYVRYRDLAGLVRSGTRLSHYAVGCDEAGLVRVGPHLAQYPFCGRCMHRDELGRGCEKHILGARPRAASFAHHFEFSASCAPPYHHAQAFFPTATTAQIPLPINVGEIPFEARSHAPPIRIMHAATRRGMKSTAEIFTAMDALANHTSVPFVFDFVENVSHREFLRRLKGADILIDQLDVPAPGMGGLEAMAMGKIVISGNMAEQLGDYPFLQDSPVFHGDSTPGALVATVAALLARWREFPELAARNRAFVAERHDHVAVAERFVALWRGTHPPPPPPGATGSP